MEYDGKEINHHTLFDISNFLFLFNAIAFAEKFMNAQLTFYLNYVGRFDVNISIKFAIHDSSSISRNYPSQWLPEHSSVETESCQIPIKLLSSYRIHKILVPNAVCQMLL